MDDTQPLAKAIEAFLARHPMSAVRFGREAMNDPHFVRDIRAGRRVWPETEARVRGFMAGYVAEQAAA
jgi:2,4-dienoyl-CoA reductase-like NADH-dependent reductase (Old Yellow Enzyme family)